MKIFDGMQSFFTSLGEYVKNFSNLFLIFLGAFLLISVIIIVITSFAYECKLTKTIDKINKFLERNPRINDDNLVAFNNMMKASSVPKILRRQWQQFMLYREHPASYYMSFKHCVENPLRNSTYRQQMTVYRIISLVLVALSLVVSTFMAVQSFNSNLVLQDIVIIPITILVLYWLVSMVLDLIHSAVSGDLFQNYQYFEINIDKAMLTLPEFVDYEVLFSQDEIKRGIPVLFAYLQKRAIQEQQELEKARLKSVDHEKFDFDQAGLDGSLVLDRAMRETENYTTQRKKYMQEAERVNNEIAVLENNYKEQMKEFQRQVQTSKETVENLKEQLEQASSTIEINYIKKQMRDEINRQQLSEKEFDILTDKHNQEIKTLNQEIKHYDEETKKAKEAMEVAMLSEFNTYSIKVYDNLEKIVDEKMQDRVDDYKDQIKNLEIELEEKSEELENVYTRYQEVLSQVPAEPESSVEEPVEELPIKKGKRKKKDSRNESPADNGMTQPDPIYPVETETDQFGQYDMQAQDYDQYEAQANDYEQYGNNQDYVALDDQVYETQNYTDDYNQDYAYNDQTMYEDDQYIPINNDQGEYIPLNEEFSANEEYIPLDNSQSEESYIPLDDYSQEGFVNGEYIPLDEAEQYIPLQDENVQSNEQDKNDTIYNEQPVEEQVKSESFDDSDFDIDFNKPNNSDFDDIDFDIDFGLEDKEPEVESNQNTVAEEDDGEFDLNKVLGLYDNVDTNDNEKDKLNIQSIEDNESVEQLDENQEEVVEPIVKRKAGRPRKIVDETEILPKRKVGRPRKIKEDDSAEEKPKRKAGRPRKIVDETEVLPKRKAGRPRKEKSDNLAEDKPKRKAGRPRKDKINNLVEDKPKRKAGRPRKEKVDNSVEEKPKRKAGRPRKDKINNLVEDKPKRKAGRPKKLKELYVSDGKSKRKAGRPRKAAKIEEVVVKGTKRRGRPKKQSSTNAENRVIDEQGVLGKPKRKAGRPRKNDN